MSARIAVVGGGLAGISAALRCRDAGNHVTVFEARGSLGGLTNSFARGELQVDNGQHVFLRCCTSYRRLLERLGVQDQVTLQRRLDIDVRMPSLHREARLRRTRLPAPFHLAGSLLRYSPLDPADRLRAIRGALSLRRLDRADTALDERSFGDWLMSNGQNDRIVAALWDLFAVATLNSQSADSSLEQAAMVFQTGLFTTASAGDIGWSLVPLQQLHGDAASRSLTTAGADVRTKAKIDLIEAESGGWVLVDRDGIRHQADQVVLAVPPAHAEKLLPPDSLDLEPGWSDRLGSSPIINAHVVLHRRVMEEPFVAGVGTPAQWVFDRTAQSGLASGQYLAVSISAADDWVDMSTAAVREQVLPALLEMFPDAARATVLDFFVTREREATIRPAPGTARFRPGPVTAHPGLVLAGAWTATGWPATMESAVRSGEAAAAALHVPVHGTDQKGFKAA